MATKIGYVSQPPVAQINWAEVGANFSGMLNEEARVREEKKAEIDRATREQIKVLQNAPMGDSKNINELALNYSGDAQKYLLMLNAELKSGRLKPNDYTVKRQNLADGTDQFFSLEQEYQNEYADKMARLKSNDPNASSQDLEVYLMQTVEGFSNFNKAKLVIDPMTGNVMVGFKNEKGELDSDPNKLVGVNNLRNRITAKYDRYNMEAAVLDGQKIFGKFDMITRELGKKGRLGTIIKYSDPALRTKEGLAELVKNKTITQEYADGLSKFPELLNAWAEGQLSNVYNVTSLLTNNLPSIGGQNFNFTSNPAEQDANTILLKQVDGNIVPDFESAIGKKQYEIAKEGLKDVFTGSLDHTVDVSISNDYTPPQERRAPTESEIARAEGLKKEVTNVTAVGSLYFGTAEQIKTAREFLRSTNPNIDLIRRDTEGVEIVFKDGRIEELPFASQSQEQWVTGSTNFFLPENQKINDVSATIKRSGADFTKPLNTVDVGESFGMVETTEPVNTTLFRVLGTEKGFTPDVFVVDDESQTVSNIENLLSAYPAAADWSVNETNAGNDEVTITNKDGKVLASFDLDDVDGFNSTKATEYSNTLINIIIANIKDADKAQLIEGKQTKETKAAAISTKTAEERKKAAVQAKREKEYAEKEKAAIAAGDKEFEFEGKTVKVNPAP